MVQSKLRTIVAHFHGTQYAFIDDSGCVRTHSSTCPTRIRFWRNVLNWLFSPETEAALWCALPIVSRLEFAAHGNGGVESSYSRPGKLKTNWLRVETERQRSRPQGISDQVRWNSMKASQRFHKGLCGLSMCLCGFKLAPVDRSTSKECSVVRQVDIPIALRAQPLL